MSPVSELGLVIGPAVAAACLPGALRGALLFEREAILHGQVWRLWTGHWVHFSMSHLAWNLAVLAVAGAWLARLRPGWLGRFVVVAAPLISGALLVGQPEMRIYGGLSGLGTGLVTLLGWVLLTGRAGEPADRGWGALLLALVAAKLGFDLWSGAPLLSEFASAAVRPAPLAHLAGAAIAVMALAGAHRLAGRGLADNR